MQRQYSTYNKQLVTGLKENGLEIVGSYEDLTEKEQKFVEEFFENDEQSREEASRYPLFEQVHA